MCENIYDGFLRISPLRICSSNRAQISNLNPFVSDIHQLSVLDTEYEDDPIYSAKLENLSTKYKAIRRTRPDGNCFFRAFAYGYLEYLVKQGRHEYEAFRELAEKSKDRLIKLGFPQFTLEDFHDTVTRSIDFPPRLLSPGGDLAHISCPARIRVSFRVVVHDGVAVGAAER